MSILRLFLRRIAPLAVLATMLFMLWLPIGQPFATSIAHISAHAALGAPSTPPIPPAPPVPPTPPTPPALPILPTLPALPMLSTLSAPPSATICDGITTIPEIECDTLVTFYDTTNGSSWTDNSNWLTINPSTSPCDWYGVSCAANHVTGLDLINNGLSGSLPPELGHLINLTTLDLADNELSGSLPPELGHLTNLTTLRLYKNQISESLPPELGYLSSLTYLHLGANQFSGSLPSELGYMTNLTYLSLSWNQFSESLPAELGYMANLTSLYASGNQFSESLPTELGHLTSLRLLHLYINQLSGPLPAELGHLTNLTTLNLKNNQLSGPLPAELGHLTGLTQILLSNNQISDTLPAELGHLTNLTDLDLHTNQLSGLLPAELGHLTNLTDLDLHTNQLSGLLPAELGHLTNLTNIQVEMNQLSGTIPAELGNLTNLRTLWLHKNALSGEIPSSICDLVETVTTADFTYNMLTSSNPITRDCVNDLQSEWADSQTVPPSTLQATNLSNDAIELSWKPVTYTTHAGGYEVTYAINTNGPYIVAGMTSDKSASTFIVNGLAACSTYYFRLRSNTPAHDTQQNDLWSDYTPVISATTSGLCSTLHLYALSFDNRPTSTHNLSPYYTDTLQGIVEATVNEPNKTAVILADLDGVAGDTEIVVAQNGVATTIPVENVLGAAPEYDMTDGNTLGEFIRWAKETYPAHKSTFSYVGHGTFLAPDADISQVFDDSPSDYLTRRTDGLLFPLPTEKEINPDLTDHHPFGLISPHDLAEAMRIGTDHGNKPLTVLDLTHCFAASIEEFYELSNAGGTPYAEIMVGSPNYMYFGPEMAGDALSAVQPSDSGTEIASAIIGAYESVLHKADLSDGNANVDHPRIMVAVESSKIPPIKQEMDELSEELMTSFEADATDTKRNIMSAYNSSAKYDTTFCAPQDWELAQGDALSDLAHFTDKLSSTFGSSSPVGIHAANVMTLTDAAVVASQKAEGTPWFADSQTPDWRFPGVGMSLYTDFQEVNANGTNMLSWHAHWYTETISSKNPNPYAFVQGNVTWADVFARFWEGETVETVACLPTLPPIRQSSELSAIKIIEPASNRLTNSLPVYLNIEMSSNQVSYNPLVHFRVQQNGMTVFSNTVGTGHLVTGTHQIEASRTWIPTQNGSFTLEVFVDSDDRIKETNEHDNKLTMNGLIGSSNANIWISPPLTTTMLSELVTVDIRADNVENLYGAQVELTFDHTILQVEEIEHGTFLVPDTIIRNSADNDNGIIEYSISLQGNKPGVNGSGTLARITFRTVTTGTSPLDFTKIVLSDPQSGGIDVTQSNGQIIVEEPEPDTLTVRGQVILERRESNAGVEVCAAGSCVTTAEDGFYMLDNLPLTGNISFSHQSYLESTLDYEGEAPSTSSGTASLTSSGTEVITLDVTLLGGDVNQDGNINILDAAIVGSAWNSTPSDAHWNIRADITDDGVINIRDMVAVQYNWDENNHATRRPTTQTHQVQRLTTQTTQAQVLISPINSRLFDKGQLVEMDLMVEEVEELYSFSIVATFDPTLLQVQDANPRTSQIDVALGEFLDPLNHFVLVNQVDNEIGVIELSVTQTHPAKAKSGSGVLGTIIFESIAEGSSNVQLTNVQLVDHSTPNPQFIPVETESGQVIVGQQRIYLPLMRK